MQKKTLSIGGATYDLFVRLPAGTIQECSGEHAFALSLGAKIRVEDLVETCGGGAANTAVGLRRLGCAAAFEGIIASDQWGGKLLETLNNEGVDTSCVTLVEDEVSSFSIILSGSGGERVILYDPGANEHLHVMTFDKEMLKHVDWVYLNHLQEDSCIIQDDIVEMLIAEGSPGLTWNPGGCQIAKGLDAPDNRLLLEHTDLLLLNKEEALLFSKADSQENSIRVLLHAGASNVAITDGKRGTVASDGRNIFRCLAVADVQTVDTTGAGDAFGTATTWGLLHGLSLPDAVKAGSINAASVVGAMGAQAALLTDIEIRKRMTNIDLDVSVEPL